MLWKYKANKFHNKLNVKGAVIQFTAPLFFAKLRSSEKNVNQKKG